MALSVPKTMITTAYKEIDKIVERVNQMIVLLVPAPACIALLAEMVAITAKDDIAVAGGKNHFKDINSLRACLGKIANAGYTAFNTAHSNMNRISAQISTVPDQVKEMTTVLVYAESAEDLGMVKDMAESAIRATNESTELAAAVYKMFNIIIEQVNELMEICQNSQSKTERELKEHQASDLAIKYVEETLLANRKAEREQLLQKWKNRLNESVDKVFEKDAAAEDGNAAGSVEVEFSKMSFNDTMMEATLDRRIVKELAENLPSFFCEDSKPNLVNTRPENGKGALFVKCTMEIVRDSFISIQTSTLKILLQEAINILEAITADEMKPNPAKHQDAKELAAKIAAWKYAPAPAQPPPSVNIDTSKTAHDLNAAREVLLSSFTTLVTFRNTWKNLVTFFEDLAIILETTLKSSITGFLSKSQAIEKTRQGGKPISAPIKNLLLTQAITVCRTAYQVCVVADSYKEIHQKHLQANLDDLAMIMGKNDIDVTKNRIATNCKAAEQGVKNLTEKKAKEMKHNFEEWIQEIIVEGA